MTRDTKSSRYGDLVGATLIAIAMASTAAAETASPASASPAPAALTKSEPVEPKTKAKDGKEKGKEAEAAKPQPIPEVISVTRVVGEVATHFVTSREVRISDAIDQALSPKPGGAVPRIMSGQEKTFPSDVSSVLDQWVVYLEAKSFSANPPTRTDVAKAIKSVQDLWGAKPAWTDLEVGTEELREMVERKLVAQEFERLKSDSSLVPVSDEDALQYYKKNRLRFGSMPFSAFKDNIKAFLVRQQTERRLNEWHEVLRRKYKVRNSIAG